MTSPNCQKPTQCVIRWSPSALCRKCSAATSREEKLAANAEKNRALMRDLMARPDFKERNLEGRRRAAERRYGFEIPAAAFAVFTSCRKHEFSPKESLRIALKSIPRTGEARS